MKAQIKIEAIGDNTYQMMRGWTSALNRARPGLGNESIGKLESRYYVAEIKGFKWGETYDLKFLAGKKDYTKSNSKGSRGVFVYYLLETGRFYKIKSPVSWHKTETFFCTVTEQGDIQRVSEEQVKQWINDRLESM